MSSGEKFVRFFQPSLRLYLITAIYLAAAGLWIFLAPVHPPVQNLSNLLLACVPTILTIWLCLRASRLFRTTTRYISTCLGAGTFLWVAEKLVQSLVPQIKSNLTIQSIFTWINLAGWLLFLLATLIFANQQRRVMMKLKLLLDLVITSGSFVVLCYVLFINPETALFAAPNQTGGSLTWYSIQDLILVALIANVLLLTFKPIQGKLLVFLLAAMLCFYFTNIYGVIPDTQMALMAGILTSLNLVLATGCLFVAATLLPGLNEEFSLAEPNRQLLTGWAIRERIQTTLPIALPIVLVGELLVFWQMGQRIDSTVLVATSMIWLLLIARLGVAAGEFELQQYALLFHNSSEPAFLCDHRLRLIQVNPAMLHISGLESEDDMLGRNLRQYLSQPVIPGQISDKWSGETLWTHASGHIIPVDMGLQAIELGFFRRKLITGAIHDLTSQKDQQEKLQQAYERVSHIQAELQNLNEDLEIRVAEKTRSLSQAYVQLEEQHTRLQSLDQMKSDFVSLVSHELRAPLTNISGGIELLLAGKKPVAESTRQSLLLVQSEIKRLSRFVETILDLSALDAGKMPLYPEPVLMDELALDLQKHYHTTPAGARLSWSIPAGLPPVHADSQALMSIYLHIIDNALKYAPAGGIQISAEYQPDQGQVVATVADGGPGIPADVMDNIFDKFFRAENADARTIYGHGLGLYMARKLLQEMGGDIKAENRPTGGAMFTFWLPEEKSSNE